MSPGRLGLFRPRQTLIDAVVGAGLPPSLAVHRATEDQGVLASQLDERGWQPTGPLLELGCGLARGAALCGGMPPIGWSGLESSATLARVARTLAPGGAVLEGPLERWPEGGMLRHVLAWDAYGRVPALDLDALMTTARRRLAPDGWLLLRWPETGHTPAPDPVLHGESALHAPRYGDVPRAAARQGLGAIRRSLHSDPGWVVWHVGPSAPIERRHDVPR